MASMAAGATGGYLGMQRLEAMRAESNGLGGDAIHAAGLSGYTAGSLQAGSIKAQGLLHNAAQSEGLIPPGADMSDFGTMAKTSAKLGTPGGAVGYTVGPDGQVVQSDKNASHTAEYGGMGMQDPSTHWKGHGHETVQAAMSNTMKNTAARNLNKSQTTMSQADSRLGFAEANALSSSLAAVKGLQQAGRIRTDEANRMAASYQNLESAKTGATETLKKTRGYSHEQAEAIVRGLSATGGVGFNFIVKAQGMSEVTTRNSGQMTAQDKAEEDKAFTNLKEAQKQVGHTDERTRGLLKSDSSEQSKGLRESFDAAHTKRQEAAQGYQKAATDVTTAQDTYQYAKEHGASLAMSLFPEVVDKMNSELGPEKTAKTMSEVGIGSHPQAEQTVQDYAQGVINDHLQQGTLQIKTPQDIDKGHAEQSSSVNARISEGRQSSEKRVAGQGGDNFDAVRQKAAGEYGVKGHSDFSTQQQQFWRGDRPEAPGNWRQDPRFKDSEGKTMKEQIDKAGADRFQDSANLRDNVTDRLDSVLWNTTNKASRWLAGFGDVDNVPALMKDIQPLPRDHWKGPQTPSGTNGTAVDTSRPKEPSSPTDGQRYWETDSRFGKSPSNAGDQATIPSHTPIRLR